MGIAFVLLRKKAVTELFYPGRAEALKWSVHAGLFGLSAVCVAYNTAAWLLRREPHLARNVAIYSSIVCLELMQMERHSC